MHKKQNNLKGSKIEKSEDTRNSTLTHLSALCACFYCYGKAFGAAQGQMKGSFIIHCIYFFLGGSSEADMGQFHQGKIISNASICL